MGQAGAQREPSMEEILASIRRIIENNEPGPDGNPVGNDEALSQHAADENAYEPDYDEQESEGQRTAANDAPVAQPVSLAEVAARARVASEIYSVPETYPADAPIDEPREELSDSGSEMDDAAAEELREALTSDEPVELAAETVPDAVEQIEDEPAAQEPEVEIPETSSDQPELREDQQSGGQLVSLQTGEKVAASFSELDAAIAAGQQRSFDEIAEEMLGPMLTQWLDDNLPTLVERLVREEIERVSRGNRR